MQYFGGRVSCIRLKIGVMIVIFGDHSDCDIFFGTSVFAQSFLGPVYYPWGWFGFLCGLPCLLQVAHDSVRCNLLLASSCRTAGVCCLKVAQEA